MLGAAISMTCRGRLFSRRDFGDVPLGAARVRTLDPRQRPLALHDPERAVAALLLDELVERARLAHVVGDVRRKRRRHLPVAREADREAGLLNRGDDSLRLRDELHLAQPAGRDRRLDEPLRVLRTQVAVDSVLDRLGAELRDRVPRIDALRAALVAEVAAGAVPD